MAVETDRNYEQKVFQDLNLSQNEIHNVSKIYNEDPIEIKSTDVLITDNSESNSIEVTKTSSEAKGNLFEVNTSVANIKTPNTINIGNNNSIIEAVGQNDLKISSSGSSPVTSAKLDSLKKENGSVLESTQVNSDNINANDVYFDDTFTGRDIQLYWDDNRKSLLFIKKKEN